MRGTPDSDDYIILPDSKNKGISSKSSQLHNSISDSTRTRQQIKQLQQQVDRLKLENYHLKDEVKETHHVNRERTREMEDEIDQLRQMVKHSSGHESGEFLSSDKYNRALREIGKLLNINHELKAELQYLRGSQNNNLQNQQLYDQLRRYQQQIVILEKQNQNIRYKMKESNLNEDTNQHIFDLENRLTQKESIIQELHSIIEKNGREYQSINNRLQNTIEDQGGRFKMAMEEQKMVEIDLREQIEEYQRRQRSNERQLQSIKTQAGYFHTEIKQLKHQLQQLQSINQQLRREVNKQESSISDSSTFGELKVYINNLNTEVQNLRQFNMSKDTNELIAENQMLERQIFGLNNRNSLIEKENAQLKINTQEYLRKLDMYKNKYQSLVQSSTELENNYLKKEQRLAKIERDNQLLKEKILHPEVIKAIADIEAAEDIDIDELKVKVRNCILILELFLNDPSQPLAPKQIQVQQLHNIKTLLIEIDIKVKSLVEQNHSMKKQGRQNQQIIEQLEDINSRLGSQCKGYQLLIRKLQQQFQRSITRNQKIQFNYSKQVSQQIGYLKQQSTIEMKHMKQELDTVSLEYQVKLTSAKNNYKKLEVSLHNAYQQKQEELTVKLRDLDKAHSQAIRQLRLLGPEKQETIARLYSSVHDLQLELKLYKSKNEISEKTVIQLTQQLKVKQQSTQILQNNIKVVLSSQGQNLQQLQNYKLKQKDYHIRNQTLNQQFLILSEKVQILQSSNITLQSQLHITQQQASQFYHRSQNITNQLNARTLQYQTSKEQILNETAILKQRVQQITRERYEIEELRIKQEKYHGSQLSIFRKNYQQKVDMLERSYQESARVGRGLQEKVDQMTLINVKLLGELRRREGGVGMGVGIAMSEEINEVQKSYSFESHAVEQRFVGA